MVFDDDDDDDDVGVGVDVDDDQGSVFSSSLWLAGSSPYPT